jgi:hypothetical protein
MSLYEFNALNELEQTEVLKEYREKLSKRKEGEYSVTLYQIDSFYVELYSHNFDRRYRSF